jgi:RNA polymerase sigma-70 factor (ECF subfamily)
MMAMDSDDERFAALWQEHRGVLVDVAFRMLGSIGEAEDMVQEAFVRLLQVDVDELDDVRGWLVVVVSRLCLDRLRSARSRREEPAAVVDSAPAGDPADRVTLDDSVRMALLVLLERLTPAERAAFVLHDVFQFSFDDVAAIVGRTPAASRQLASRARRRLESETEPARFSVDTAEQQRVAERFIAACSLGDVKGLLQLLDPDAAGVVDLGPLATRPPVVGAPAVAENVLRFFGPGPGRTLVSHVVNGEPAVLAFRDRALFAIVVLTLEDGRVHHLHGIADPAKLALAGALLA